MRKFEQVITRKHDVETLLPLRATRTSAGYDFFTPVDLIIPPQSKVFFFTDVKVQLEANEFLMLDVRSSIGVKRDLMLANTIGIIDSDYHNNSDNEGNIGICLRNLKPTFEVTEFVTLDTGAVSKHPVVVPNVKDLREENTIILKAGEKVAQGIILEFKSTVNCNSEEDRNGGFGSTNN